MPTRRLLLGNCKERLKDLEDNSIDSVITDPPYEISIMGRKWDSRGVAYDVELWQEVLRVLKPGGFLLSFGGTRTYHRMACAIEDAGFEIRDTISWVYATGFPKGMNLSKEIDRHLGATRDKIRVPASEVRNPKSINGGHDVVGGDRPWMQKALELGYHEKDSLDSVTDEAKQWEGWNIALKPAHEPIVVARKPLSEPTVAANVLKWGTGGVNIDACRVEGTKQVPASPRRQNKGDIYSPLNNMNGSEGGFDPNLGRWPANFIHDGSDEVLEMFPESNGQQGDLKSSSKDRPGKGIFSPMPPPSEHKARTEDAKNAARFFFCAKPSNAERNAGVEGGCHHPTVKPITLMRYLVRLVTPPEGTVLDPFLGSGTTGCAALLEKKGFIGIELEAESFALAKQRMLYWKDKA